MSTCDAEQRKKSSSPLPVETAEISPVSTVDDKLWQEQAETEEDVLQFHWALDWVLVDNREGQRFTGKQAATVFVACVTI